MEDISLIFIELGAAIIGLALLTRLASRLGFSAIPLYLLAGLAFGNGGILPLQFSELRAARQAGHRRLLGAGLLADRHPDPRLPARMESARRSLAWRRHLHLIIRRHRKSIV